MAATGGYEALKPDQQESAQRSHEHWLAGSTDEKPRTMGLEECVSHIQGKEAEARAKAGEGDPKQQKSKPDSVLGKGTGTAEASLAERAVRALERAKWRLWHGRWPGCRRTLAALCRWAARRSVRDIAGTDKLRRLAADLLEYLERNEAALGHYAARRRRGEPIATSFVESAVDEIISWRMAKVQQMRWSRATVPAFLDVRTAVLNDTLEDAFRRRHPGFRPANDNQRLAGAAA